jgi:ribosome-associated protein
MDDLFVTPDLTVPASELAVRFSRSGGPGGQHVNTASTRVELVWNVAMSLAPSEAQRVRILEGLASRLDGDGNLRVVVEETRSQHDNRERALARLRTLVAHALRPRRVRRPTSPTAASRERRLARKRRRAEVKRMRGTPHA